MQKKYVLIADIINSRQIKNRGEIQIELNEAVKEIYIMHKDKLLDKVLVARGDEVVTVADNLEVLLKIIENFRNINKSVKYRFGIGFGEVSHGLDIQNFNGIYGPAFDNAEKAINQAKKLRMELFILNNGIETFDEKLNKGTSKKR